MVIFNIFQVLQFTFQKVAVMKENNRKLKKMKKRRKLWILRLKKEEIGEHDSDEISNSSDVNDEEDDIAVDENK